MSFSLLICCERRANTHAHTQWYGSIVAVKVDCLRVFLTAGKKPNFYPRSALDHLQEVNEIKSEKSTLK